MSIILGIDPGIASCGYGIIERQGINTRYVEHGLIATPAHMELLERLECIYNDISTLIERTRPDVVAIERLFFTKNAKTAITIGQAQGVIFLAVRRYRLPVLHFTPLQVKQAVASYGRADKKQVQHMVKLLLNMSEIPEPDDAADGLALALCCVNLIRTNV